MSANGDNSSVSESSAAGASGNQGAIPIISLEAAPFNNYYRGRRVDSAIYGSQSYAHADKKYEQLYAGTMHGCFLIIGIHPSKPSQQYILHDNLSHNYVSKSDDAHSYPDHEGAEIVKPEDEVRAWIYQDNYILYLFFTHKSAQELAINNKDTFVSRLQEFYKRNFSGIFYVDDSELDQVEAIYQVATRELTVLGRAGWNTTCQFKAKIELPQLQKEPEDPRFTALKHLIGEKFQSQGYTPGLFNRNKIPAGVEELLKATSLEEMRLIAKRKQLEPSRFRSEATQALYDILAHEHKSIHAIQNEIKQSRKIQAIKKDEPDEKSCCVM